MNAIPKIGTKPDPKHLAYVRSLPCCCCYAPPPSEAHHVRIGHQGGTSMRPPDSCAVPLCRECHDRLHLHGEHEFWIQAFKANRVLRCEMVLSLARSHKR